jgi:hypothetical protein
MRHRNVLHAFVKSEIDYICIDQNASYEEPLQSGAAETRRTDYGRGRRILLANKSLWRSM